MIRFVRALPRTERRSKVRVAKGERGIWQRRFREHTVRNEVDYLHWSPMKPGMIQRIVDWPYSSFHRYIKAGLYPGNWTGCVSDDKNPEFGE